MTVDRDELRRLHADWLEWGDNYARHLVSDDVMRRIPALLDELDAKDARLDHEIVVSLKIRDENDHRIAELELALASAQAFGEEAQELLGKRNARIAELERLLANATVPGKSGT